MVGVMGSSQHLSHQWRRWRYIGPVLESNDAVAESPRGAQLARMELLTECHQSWIRLCRLPEGVEEVKSRSRDGTGVARRERASATIFWRPGLYSTVKSNPRSLPTQWCWGMVARCWSSKNLRL